MPSSILQMLSENPLSRARERAFAVALLLGLVVFLPDAEAGFNFENDSGAFTNYFSGNTLYQLNNNNLTFNNSSVLSSTNLSLPLSTGPLFVWDTQVDNGQKGTRLDAYYYSVGTLIWNTYSGYTLTTINNAASGVMNGSITNTGKALAAGFYSYQQYGFEGTDSLRINNAGTMEGISTNNDSTVAGIYAFNLYGNAAVTNSAGGLCLAAGTFDSTGINVGVDYGAVKAENNGTITAIAYGGQGDDAGVAYAQGIDLFGYDNNSGSPLNFTNSGTVQSFALGNSSGTNICFGTFMWAEGGSMTFNNSGTCYAQANDGCSGAYVGGNRGPDVINNWGTIQGVAPYGGWGLGVENDTGTTNDTYNTITINNWGTITHNSGYGLFMYAGHGYATINNYGTIYGAGECIHAYDYPGNTTVNVYGPVQASGAGNLAINLGTGNNTVNVYGLPVITGLINGGRGAGAVNTLHFALSGVLQQVNGQSPYQGNNLSAYNLGSSGSIIVSGQTYTWENFSLVTGTVSGNPPTILFTSAFSGNSGATVLPGNADNTSGATSLTINDWTNNAAVTSISGLNLISTPTPGGGFAVLQNGTATYANSNCVFVNCNLSTNQCQRGYRFTFTLNTNFNLATLTVVARHTSNSGNLAQQFTSDLHYSISGGTLSAPLAGYATETYSNSVPSYTVVPFSLNDAAIGAGTYTVQVYMTNLVSGGAYATYQGITLAGVPSNQTFAPTFSPPPGGYVGSQTITIGSDTAGAVIYYTTNGSAPTVSSPSGVTPVTLVVPANTNLTIQAFAQAPGDPASSVQSAVYTTYTNYIWINPAGGNWSGVANWSNSAVASGAGTAAAFAALTLRGTTLVPLDIPATVGSLVFGDQGNMYGWTVTNAGAVALTLNNGANPPVIEVSNQTATISALLAGANGLVETGSGVLVLSNADTISGVVTVNGGVMALDYNPGDASTGTLSSGTSVKVNPGGALRFDVEDALGYGGGIPSQLNINGGLVTSANVGNRTPVQNGGASFRVTLPTLGFSGGTLSSGNNNVGDRYGGSYLVGSAVNTLASSNTAVINAYSLSLLGTTFTVAAGTTPSAEDLAVFSILENWNGNSESLTKAGPGVMILSNANTYTGGTTINGGTLALDYNAGDNPTGTLQGGTAVTVNNGGTLRLDIQDALGFNGGIPSALNINGGLVTSANVANTTPVQNGGTSFRVTLPTLIFTGGTLSSGVNNHGDTYGGSYLVGGVNYTLASTNTAVINAYAVSLQNNSTFNVAAGTTPSGVDLEVSSILKNWLSGAQGLTKSGSGVMRLDGVNTYSGPTTISAGTLALAGSGSIASSPYITIAGAATFDVSGLSSPFVLGGGQTLNNSTSTAVLKGNASTSSGTLSLNYTNGLPALTVSNGILTLSSGTSFKINNLGGQLAVGSYKLISKSASGAVGGTVATNTVPVSGGGTAASATLTIANGELNLVVGIPVNTTPTNIVASASGSQLTLQWPRDHTGWTLESNSISVSNPNDWFAVPGSTTTNIFIITINPALSNVFYRMTY